MLLPLEAFRLSPAADGDPLVALMRDKDKDRSSLSRTSRASSVSSSSISGPGPALAPSEPKRPRTKLDPSPSPQGLDQDQGREPEPPQALKAEPKATAGACDSGKRTEVLGEKQPRSKKAASRAAGGTGTVSATKQADSVDAPSEGLEKHGEHTASAIKEPPSKRQKKSAEVDAVRKTAAGGRAGGKAAAGEAAHGLVK